jgi:putative ABC transport system permease protein
MRPEHWLYTIPLRLRSLFRWEQADQQLDDELRDHLDRKTLEYVAQGMTQEEAHRRARLDLDGIEQTKEKCRDTRRVNWIQDFVQDLRFGLRMLRKSPGFTCVAVLTLALGVSANTAIFSIVDAVLLRDLPYKDAQRLVAVWCAEIGQPGTKIFASYGDFEEFKAHSQSFDELAAVTWAQAGEILTWKGSPHHVLAIPASADFFSLLGIPGAQGRTFGPGDLQNGCTVVLADSFWQKDLGAPAGIVGAPLSLNGKPCTVVGIMPHGFDFYPKQTSLWTLISPDSQFSKEPYDSVVGMFGRLKPGVSMADAEQELVGLHQRVIRQSPAGNWVAQIKPIVRDLREEFTWLAGRNLRAALLILSAAVTLLLLIACLNVANLLLGRSVERYKELAVRSALGSGCSRLVRQLFTESLLLAVLGTSVGVLISVAAVRYFDSTNLVELPPGNQVTINPHVLAFAAFLTSMTALLFGLLPAWRSSRVDLNDVLKESVRTMSLGRHRTSQFLVVGQVTLSMVLLAAAGLMIQSFLRLGAVPLGFQPDHVLTAQVALPPSGYTDLGRRSSFYETLTARLGALPGVEGAALSSGLLGFDGGGSSRLSLAGRAPIENLEAVRVEKISSGYFRVLGIPSLQGRQFDPRDRNDSQPVAIVNEQLVHRYFPKENPVGRQIKLGRPEDKAPWLTIVGVVGNEKRGTVYHEMSYDEPALVYLPVDQTPPISMVLQLRAAGNPLGLGPVLQAEVTQIDPNVPVYDIETMVQRESEFLVHPRFRALLMGILAGITLLLTAIGLYGLLAHLVSQRTHEIGIRVALGASRQEVLGLVVWAGLRTTVIGLAVGIALALASTRLLSGLLFGIKSTDPVTFVAVAILLCVVALLACWVPAQRAVRVDPMVALRYE